MQVYFYRLLFSLLTILVVSFTSLAQSDWQLKKDKDEIQVYIMEDEYSDFNPYKSVVIMEGNIHDFEALIKDSPRMKEWSESVLHVEILEELGDSVQIYYSMADAPFPIKNRDGIYQNSFRWLEEGKILRIDVKLLPDYIEANEDCERVTGWGYWQVEDVGQGNIQVICEMHIHPGGNIPAWLANAFADENPYKNMIEIRKIMSKKAQ